LEGNLAYTELSKEELIRCAIQLSTCKQVSAASMRTQRLRSHAIKKDRDIWMKYAEVVQSMRVYVPNDIEQELASI